MPPKTYPYYKPAGDSALLVVFGSEIDLQTNQKVHELDKLLRQTALDGVGESIPTYTSLLLYYDPCKLGYGQVLDWVKQQMDVIPPFNPANSRLVEIPTRYGGEFGPDLEHVASHNQLSLEEVIRIHSTPEYPVYMMGFTPGFPYLGGMDSAIATPRLSTPRTHVPAGSVGIAGSQTGVYPIESPGGWQIIGRTTLSLFDITRETPFLLTPGDRVKFVPVS